MGIQLIDDIRGQIETLVDVCREATKLESDLQKTYTQLRETGLTIYEIILTLSGVTAAIPEEIRDAVKDKFDIDLSDLTALADGFLDKNILMNLTWQTLLASQQEVMEAFVQKFADYMIEYVEKEEVELEKIETYINGIEETIKLLEEELKIYEYGTIRASLQAAISELREVLAYIDGALDVLSYSRMPNLAISTEIIDRYEKVQAILTKTIDDSYEQAKKYQFDGDRVWELSKNISGYSQKIIKSIAQFMIYDALIKNARLVLVYLEDIVNATIGAAERYFMETYLDAQRKELASLIDTMSGALNEYKFEPRLLGTSVVANGKLTVLKNAWMDGQIAEMFSQSYQSRESIVAFAQNLESHSYFRETDPTNVAADLSDAFARPASEQITGFKNIVINGLDKIVQVGDGRMFKSGYSMVDKLRFQLSEISSSVRGLKGTLNSYGRFEDSTGALDGLDDFFEKTFQVSMIEFILGMSGALQIANLLFTGSFTGNFQGIIGEPLVRLSGLRLKAGADMVLRGAVSVEETKAMERSQLDAISREHEGDLSITEAYVNRKAELKAGVDESERSVEEYEYLLNKGLK